MDFSRYFTAVADEILENILQLTPTVRSAFLNSVSLRKRFSLPAEDYIGDFIIRHCYRGFYDTSDCNTGSAPMDTYVTNYVTMNIMLRDLDAQWLAVFVTKVCPDST